MSNGTRILSVRRVAGVAGAYALVATVEHDDDGEGPSRVTFHGSTYGEPIIMETDSAQVYVSSAVLDRIGRELTPEWVRRFFE